MCYCSKMYHITYSNEKRGGGNTSSGFRCDSWKRFNWPALETFCFFLDSFSSERLINLNVVVVGLFLSLFFNPPPLCRPVLCKRSAKCKKGSCDVVGTPSPHLHNFATQPCLRWSERAFSLIMSFQTPEKAWSQSAKILRMINWECYREVERVTFLLRILRERLKK